MKPNIILIMTDDQTVSTIHSKGNSSIITPNLDELCTEGVYFNNCHIHGGTSGAICMPSRAITHTSQNMFNLKFAGNTVPSHHPLLGECLKEGGYETFFTGKWHNGLDAFKRSFTQGDNIFFGGMWDHYNVPMNSFDPEGKYDNKVDFVVNFFNSNKVTTMHTNKFNPGIHSTDVISNSAIKFIEEYDMEKPFFMNIAYLAPHDPRVVPNEFIQMYDNIDIDIPFNFKSKHPFLFGQQYERDEHLAPTPIPDEWYLSELKSYYGMISHLDYEIGKIIEQLKRTGKYDNTVIIFTSDNGLAIGAHGLMGKQNLYEESIRVPLIVKGINQYPKAKEISGLVTLQDLFPTILDFANIEVPTNIDGKSFFQMPINNYEIHNCHYLAFTEYVRGIKYEGYKLIKYRPENGIEINQLFNLNADKFELVNLYEMSEYTDVKRKMELKLIDMRDKFEIYDNEFTKKYWGKYE